MKAISSVANGFPLGARVRLADLAHNPYPILRRLQEDEAVSWIAELGLWFVTRRADVVAILLDSEAFTVQSDQSLLEDTLGPTMLSTDGAAQRRLRQPFQAAFLPRAVRTRMAAVVEAEANRLIDRVVAAGQAELRAAFADPLALHSVTAMLGLPVHDFAVYRGWFSAIAAALGNFGKDPELRRQGRDAAAAFGTFAQSCLPRLPDSTVLGTAPAGWSVEETLSAARVIIFGGLETTAALLLNAVWALLRHPEQLAALRKDAALLPAAVAETLRWEPPVQTCTRHVTRPVTVGGVELAPGDGVQCMIGAANRDPAHFERPDDFDITRANARDHLSFGLGKHYCLGAALAELEGEIGLRCLFERLGNLSFDASAPAGPHGHEFRSPPTLGVCWDR
jgi:cytochrome P450